MDGQGNVSLRGVAVAYGPIRVFDRLDLEVAQSEFLVLLGPSGCGKSTLLNAIAGLTEIDDGEIWIGGRNVTWQEPKDRGIAMVFQSYALYPRMNVRGNLSFGLKVARAPRAEIERRVRMAAEMLQIADLLDRRPAELSGGQRQRVAIGRALVRDAGVFLFDEPLSNLDAQLRSELRVEIKRLHQRLGATMIYVTHDQIEALTLADRIAVMKDRTFQQIGTPQEIYLRPANRFVATFVGSPAMNFVPGRIELGSDGAFVSESYATGGPPSQHLHVGSPLVVQTPSGTVLHLTVRGIDDPPKGASPFGDVTISTTLFDRVYQNPQNLFVLLNVQGGVTPANTHALNAALRGFPDAKVQTKAEFTKNQLQGLTLLLNLLYVLLSLSIVISLFGIVNTLVLTVFERTRELGMLRAVGMTRRQVRSMIRDESVITALLGAAFGIPLGVILALLIGAAIGYSAFTIPVGTLVVFVIAAVVAGLIASIEPARRASRLNILQALQYE